MMALSPIVQKNRFHHPDFLSFSKCVQENRLVDEFSFGRSVQKNNSSPITSKISRFFQSNSKILFTELPNTGRCYMGPVNLDIIEHLLTHCLLKEGVSTFMALLRMNSCFYGYRHLLNKADIKQICPPRLSVLDAETLKFCHVVVEDEPSINNLEVFECFSRLAPRVEEDDGLTVLTMPKGITLKRLIEIALDAGITIEFLDDNILPELQNIAVENTYRIMITNNVITKSRNSYYYNYPNKLMEKLECELPTVQEYVALCIFHRVINKKVLYRKRPMTYGLSSTCVFNEEILVGCSTKIRVCVSDYGDIEFGDCGAGGKQLVASGTSLIKSLH